MVDEINKKFEWDLHGMVNNDEKMSPKGIAAMQGDSKAESDWIDRGIIDVPVADLPIPEGVSSPEDFNHHITWEDAQKATKELPGIQQSVQVGKTRDDFHNEDIAAGLTYSEGKERVYDLYYGSDPIKLDKIGNEYMITTGRHRIFAAQEAGLRSIPARVFEKKPVE